jgi:predicted site-specific integrase-resolvase
MLIYDNICFMDTKLVKIGEAAKILGTTPFSARLYGSRSHKNKQLMEALSDVVSP